MRFSILAPLVTLITIVTAAPTLETRANTSVNPAAVTTTTCDDPSVYVAPQNSYEANSDSNLNTHDTNVAILSSMHYLPLPTCPNEL
jgi:hypothetical protein